MASKRPRILAIFASPDHETFLAGGKLAKYAARGWEVFPLCATHGEARAMLPDALVTSRTISRSVPHPMPAEALS